jgi:hypothetical protein
VRDAERIARKRQVSLDTLVAERLAQFVRSEDEYAAAREDHLAILSQDINLGTHGKRTWSRDDLNERD